MNCETCKAKLPTLHTRLLRVNSELHQLGLSYWDYLPVYQVDSALTNHGFAATDLWQAGNDGRHHEEVGEGKWLSVSWHKMESGRYEVVAYVN